jgi:sugar lactone lactonase YvrE
MHHAFRRLLTRILFAAALFLASVATASAVSLLSQWGKEGRELNQLRSPRAIAVDPRSGDVYIADIASHRIQHFSATGQHFKTIGGAQGGTGPSQFYQPGGVAVDFNDNVYVADTGNDRIQKFDRNLNFISTWGSRGAGNLNFNRPVALAVDRNGFVYVADSGNARIIKFTSTGQYVTQWKLKPSPNTGYATPSYVAVDPTGFIDTYFAGGRQFQQFDPSGIFIRSWKDHNTTGEIYSMTAGEFGEVYAADPFRKSIDVYESNGAYAFSIVLTNYIKDQVNFAPHGLAWSYKNDTLYMLDEQVCRVDIFNPF